MEEAESEEEDDQRGLTFAQRLRINTPALHDLFDMTTWTDEEDDEGEMEPLTHNKVNVAFDTVEGNQRCCELPSYTAV